MKKFAFCLLILASAQVWAAPDTFRFQGRLTDAQGRPITGPNVQVRFSLYGATSGGSALWQGPLNQTIETNDAGLFATDLGPISATTIGSSNDLYLQIAVHDGTGFKSLSPRQKLASVPFALQAEFAITAATASSAASVSDKSITTEKLSDGAVTESKIRQHSLSTASVNASIFDYLVPSGMVAMFARSCPTGWTRFSELDDKVALGAPTYTGSSGGSWTVSGLSSALAGQHTHTVPHSHPFNGVTNPTNPASYRCEGGFCNSGSPVLEHTHAFSGTTAESQPITTEAAAHAHTISSDGTWRPAHVGVVYCSKD